MISALNYNPELDETLFGVIMNSLLFYIDLNEKKRDVQDFFVSVKNIILERRVKKV
jgi:hypothetical protein